MMFTHVLVFSPFAENTYILYDETRECVIIDPGCFDKNEQRVLDNFIINQQLKPVALWNTHCHLDHIFGNAHVYRQYGLRPIIHQAEFHALLRAEEVALQYFGMPIERSPEPGGFFRPGTPVSFGNTTLEVLFTPGHSPGSVSFFHRSTKTLISGDVLFEGSIGRTDLPGGDYQTLMNSILHTLLPLGDDVKVLPGHNSATTIGAERASNRFIIDEIRIHYRVN